MAGRDEALLLVAEHDGPTMFARIGVMRALDRHLERVFNPDAQGPSLGAAETKEGLVNVLIYVNTSKEVGDVDHLKVFASEMLRKNGSRKTILRAWRLCIQ